MFSLLYQVFYCTLSHSHDLLCQVDTVVVIKVIASI